MSDPSLEDLLAHAGWARALARGLVRDPHAADDLLQDAWVRALEHGPRTRASARAWLRSVLRNLARQDHRGRGRRDARERAVARQEGNSGSSGEDTAQRVELQAKLARAVLELEEPYRTTLVRRFFDGEKPSQIAERQGVPLRTVETRLARGIAQLRAKLDALHGGDRRAWLPAVAGLAATGETIGRGALVAGAATLVLASAATAVALRPGDAPEPTVVHLEALAAPDPVDPVDDGASTDVTAAHAAAPSGPAQGDRTPLAAPGSALRLRFVRADDGTPVPGVSVRVHGAQAEPFEAAADPDGTLALAWSPEWRKLTLDVGASPRTQRHRVVLEEPGDELVRLQPRGGTLAGRAVDTLGRPVPGADVRLWIEPDRTVPWDAPDRRATTDAQGRFRFDDLCDERGRDVRVDVGGRAPALAAVEWLHRLRVDAESADDVELLLGPALEVDGRVLAATGGPIEGAHVLGWTRGHGFRDLRREQAQRAPDRGRARWRRSLSVPPTLEVVTDADGRFRWISSLEPWHLQVDHEAWPRWMGWVETSGPLDIVLSRGTSVGGRVTDEAGAPLEGVTVRIWCKEGREPVTTAADGRWGFDGLTAMEGALVGFRREDRATQVEILDLPEGVASRLDVALAPGRVVGGVVRFPGQPPDNLRVRIQGDRPIGSPWLPRERGIRLEELMMLPFNMTRDGTFRFEGLYDGEFRVFAEDARTHEVYAAARVRSGVADLVLEPGDGLAELVTVHGRVVDGRTGAPVPSCTLHARTFVAGERNPTWSPIRRDVEDPEGRFTLTGLVPGRWAFEATARGDADSYLVGGTELRELAAGVWTVEVVLGPPDWAEGGR